MFSVCQCEHPFIKCSNIGCICQQCGLPERNIFNTMEAQNNLLKGRNISVLEKEIWNAAIEKAAQSVGLGMAEVELGELADDIRKLKV